MMQFPFNPKTELYFVLPCLSSCFVVIFLICVFTSAFVWLNSEPCGVFCGRMSWAFLAYGMGATTVTCVIHL